MHESSNCMLQIAFAVDKHHGNVPNFKCFIAIYVPNQPFRALLGG